MLSGGILQRSLLHDVACLRRNCFNVQSPYFLEYAETTLYKNLKETIKIRFKLCLCRASAITTQTSL